MGDYVFRNGKFYSIYRVERHGKVGAKISRTASRNRV